MPARIAQHLMSTIAAVLNQPSNWSPLAWLWGLLGALGATLWTDTFPGIFVLACVASLLDLHWGARAARAAGAYTPERKRNGRDGKIITLSLILMLRLAEAWAVSHGLLPVEKVLSWMGLEYLANAHVTHDGGIISALIAAAVFWDEAASCDLHRRRLGGKRIPLLSALLQLGRVAQVRIANALAASTAEPAKDVVGVGEEAP